jgi:hypothetical protein
LTRQIPQSALDRYAAAGFHHPGAGAGVCAWSASTHLQAVDLSHGDAYRRECPDRPFGSQHGADIWGLFSALGYSTTPLL